jgi:hypothetical protein
MDDSEQSKKDTEGDPSNASTNGRTLLQSIRIRYNTILADIADREFVESEFRYVLYSGIVLWLIHLTSVAI